MKPAFSYWMFWWDQRLTHALWVRMLMEGKKIRGNRSLSKVQLAWVNVMVWAIFSPVCSNPLKVSACWYFPLMYSTNPMFENEFPITSCWIKEDCTFSPSERRADLEHQAGSSLLIKEYELDSLEFQRATREVWWWLCRGQKEVAEHSPAQTHQQQSPPKAARVEREENGEMETDGWWWEGGGSERKPLSHRALARDT